METYWQTWECPTCHARELTVNERILEEMYCIRCGQKYEQVMIQKVD